ncbi:MAG TPA: 2-succinyl-6-hydroxy-2,4-cyclohexadiene-1-carboxylate synthase [Solirubrobacteraceae bacterium]|nr:2-succinyl-6-hydroxy-2,4-cyclohexadiene-1-carboxylate synthase [Solirubrobacteraceae bacterium]
MQITSSVVLLHGFTNTGHSWDDVIDALGGGADTLAPDIRGHGAASAERPVTLDAVIGDIDRVAPDRFTLVGYSMGGRIALHVAFALPGRVRRMVLIGASPGLRSATARAQRRASDERLAAEVEGQTIERFAARWAEIPVLADQPEPVRAAVGSDRLRNESAGLAAALRGLGTGALPSLWPRLGSLQIPVELIVGERDAKFRGIAARMAADLPHGRIVVVPGAGHAVHAEAPTAVASVIMGAPSPGAAVRR